MKTQIFELKHLPTEINSTHYPQEEKEKKYHGRADITRLEN